MQFLRPLAGAQITERGPGLLPKEAGVHVGKTIREMSLAEAAVAYEGQTPRGGSFASRFSFCRHL